MAEAYSRAGKSSLSKSDKVLLRNLADFLNRRKGQADKRANSALVVRLAEGLRQIYKEHRKSDTGQKAAIEKLFRQLGFRRQKGRIPPERLVLTAEQIRVNRGPAASGAKMAQKYFGVSPRTIWELSRRGKVTDETIIVQSILEHVLAAFGFGPHDSEVVARFVTEYFRAARREETEHFFSFTGSVLGSLAVSSEARDYFLLERKSERLGQTPNGPGSTA